VLRDEQLRGLLAALVQELADPEEQAASTSSTVAKATSPLCRPVAGLYTAPLRPDVPGTARPPIQWLICCS
jgi:hypothetical protein